MSHEFKLNEICLYKGEFNPKGVLVRVVSIRGSEIGWTHEVQILESENIRYWIHHRNLISIGENSELINGLDSVGLF